VPQTFSSLIIPEMLSYWIWSLSVKTWACDVCRFHCKIHNAHVCYYV